MSKVKEICHDFLQKTCNKITTEKHVTVLNNARPEQLRKTGMKGKWTQCYLWWSRENNRPTFLRGEAFFTLAFRDIIKRFRFGNIKLYRIPCFYLLLV